jgi:hypothetical protein
MGAMAGPPGADTLAAALGKAPFPLARSLEYATQIARELRLLHASGEVHGNVLPANIVLDPLGPGLF